MPLDEAYFVWLYSQVGSVENRNRSKTYWKLLRLLFEKEFTWREIEKDGNRAQDGKNLRKQFLSETGTKMNEPGWLDVGCSFLELMISLAWLLEFNGEGTQADWFWSMIDNLGLSHCTDANPPDVYAVHHILDRVINRDYAPNGDGGLFPLKRHTAQDEDQRDVELWYQLNAYLLERL